MIAGNLASLGPEFARAWRRILLSDALFFNTDRHMRSFGVIRSSGSGEVLRLAPNFDNNPAYDANPGGYSRATRDDLKALCAALEGARHLQKARKAGLQYL